jgi:hypothetical protein
MGLRKRGDLIKWGPSREPALNAGLSPKWGIKKPKNKNLYYIIITQVLYHYYTRGPN